MIMMDWVGNFKSGRYEVYGDLLPQAIINNNFNYFKKQCSFDTGQGACILAPNPVTTP